MGVIERELQAEPDLLKRRREAVAVPVELLGELLRDRAAAGVLIGLKGGEGGTSGAVGDVDEEVGIEVLVLDGDDGLSELPGGTRPL